MHSDACIIIRIEDLIYIKDLEEKMKIYHQPQVLIVLHAWHVVQDNVTDPCEKIAVPELVAVADTRATNAYYNIRIYGFKKIQVKIDFKSTYIETRTFTKNLLKAYRFSFFIHYCFKFIEMT